MSLPPPEKSYKIIASRDTVVFPNTATSLKVSRREFIDSIQSAANAEEHLVVVLAQKNPLEHEPTFKSLHHIGTLCSIAHVVRLPGESLKVVLEGICRVAAVPTSDDDDISSCYITPLETDSEDPEKVEAHLRILKEKVNEYIKSAKMKTLEQMLLIQESDQNNAEISTYTIASHLSDLSLKQSILSENKLTKRMDALSCFLGREAEVLALKEKIHKNIEDKIRNQHREYISRLKADAVRQELGEQDDTADLEQAIEQSGHLTKDAKARAMSELKKLRTLSNSSPKLFSTRAYIEFILSLPWKRIKRPRKNLEEANQILQESHTSLDKVNERILEFLAVKKRCEEQKGTILCFVGPPGVGKTSVAKAIAKAMNLDFASIALGGFGDEAEIRGHRRTYVGAMPGRILRALKAKNFESYKKGPSSNSMILLDEVDKMGADRLGDPGSALLEVLDPEQNHAFVDHYLEISVDLSKVFFIATANDPTRIPDALKDRMELIYLSGYTLEEKLLIAKKHLLPKQLLENGLKPEEFSITDEALTTLIAQYSRKEAGVRGVNQKIEALARKAVVEIDIHKKEKIVISPEDLQKYLGVPRYRSKIKSTVDVPGIVNGLAWTEAGGEILPIEVLMIPGKGDIQFTGKLGEVMQESVKSAFSYVRFISPRYQISEDIFRLHDFHVHFPEGAIPKDGPSAGMGICLAFISCILGRAIPGSYGVTGELSLVGSIWPIGGLKEKLLAAVRSDLETVLLPLDNEKDLEDVPDTVKSRLKITFVKHLDEAMDIFFPKNQIETKGQSTICGLVPPVSEDGLKLS